MVFCCIKHLLLSGLSLNIADGVYNQTGGLEECEPVLPFVILNKQVCQIKYLVWMQNKTLDTRTAWQG